MQLPSTLIRPSPGKLDTHLAEIIPGYFDAEKRGHPNAEEEQFRPFETDANDNHHDISNDVLQIDNSNLANGRNCQHKSKANVSETNAQMCIPVDKVFFERIHKCQQALRHLSAESKMQRVKINELQEENKRLKSELSRLKWAQEFLRHFEA